MCWLLFAQRAKDEGLPWWLIFYLGLFIFLIVLLVGLILYFQARRIVQDTEEIWNKPPQILLKPRTRTEVAMRRIGRWAVSLFMLGVGLYFVYGAPEVVIRGSNFSPGYILLLCGSIGLFGCVFGVNVFRGGPLDMRNDFPPLEDSEARDKEKK